MNEILSKLNYKPNNKYRLLKPNQYPVKKLLIETPLKVQDLLKDPRVIYHKKILNPSRINNNETNNTNFLSKNESYVYRDTSPFAVNKTFDNKINSEPIDNNRKEIKTNLTIINQNCKNPNNNKILILNTPYIEEKVNNSVNSHLQNEDSNFDKKSTIKINIFPYSGKTADSKEKTTTLINDRYHSTSPSLKKIEVNVDNTYNKIPNLKLRNEKKSSPFRTIKTDNDSDIPIKLKNSSKHSESSNKTYNNNKNGINSFITIHDEFEEKIKNENKNKIYFTSDNPNNLEIISKVNDFNKVLNIDFKKTKSNSEFDIKKYHRVDSRISLNTVNKFSKLNPANRTYSNNFYTIERFSSIENDPNYINNKIIANQENMKFKLVRKDIRDINNRVNSKITRNFSINPCSNFINSQTINTDNYFRSLSEIRPKRDSQALNDLSKILQNKSVEKLTNMKLENLELKNTKEGIDIIDKLINNLTRLKTIMIEEDEKNNKEIYETIPDYLLTEENSPNQISTENKEIRDNIKSKEQKGFQSEFVKNFKTNIENIRASKDEISKSNEEFDKKSTSKAIKEKDIKEPIMPSEYENHKVLNEDNKINYDTFALNKSIETNNFFKHEDMRYYSKKVNEIYPKKTQKNKTNNNIQENEAVKNKEEKSNQLIQPIIREIKLDPEIIIKDRKISSNYEKLRSKNLYIKTENSPSRNNKNFNLCEKPTPINSNMNANATSIFNKTSVNKTPTNLSKPNQKNFFTQNDKKNDNNPVRLKRIDNSISLSHNFTEGNNTTNYTMNNPNIISFNNFSENVFFTTGVNNKENKDITNYEFDDKFVD